MFCFKFKFIGLYNFALILLHVELTSKDTNIISYNKRSSTKGSLELRSCTSGDKLEIEDILKRIRI